MKILYFITGLGSGGAERMLQKIIENSTKHEIEVCSLTDTSDCSIAKELSVPVHDLGVTKPWHIPRAILRLRKLLLNNNYDVMNCFMVHANFCGVLANIGLKTKIVTSIRNNFASNKFLLYLNRFASTFSNVTTVNSMTCFYGLVDAGFNPAKLEVIYNGLEFDKLDKAKGIKLFDNDNPTLCMVANPRPQKDHLTMFAALRKLSFLKKFNILFIGGKRIDWKDLERQIEFKNYKILGERDDVFDIVKGCDLWVSSTLYEGQSNALLEAMYLGTPVLTTNIQENSEIVGDHGVLVPTKHPQHMYMKIKDLLEDKELCKANSMLAKKYMIKHFDIKTTVKKLEYLYDTI